MVKVLLGIDRKNSYSRLDLKRGGEISSKLHLIGFTRKIVVFRKFYSNVIYNPNINQVFEVNMFKIGLYMYFVFIQFTYILCMTVNCYQHTLSFVI